MPVVIGVDGGATKTVATVVAEDGAVLSVGTAGGFHPLVWGGFAFGHIRFACG